MGDNNFWPLSGASKYGILVSTNDTHKGKIQQIIKDPRSRVVVEGFGVYLVYDVVTEETVLVNVKNHPVLNLKLYLMKGLGVLQN